MKAVEILDRIEAYFDRNHNLFIRFGGLFAMLFFFLYVPFTIHFESMDKLEAEQERNIFLMAQMEDMNTRMEFLELSYGDEFGFDRASNNLTATSEATDLISAKKVNANDDYYEMALAA